MHRTRNCMHVHITMCMFLHITIPYHMYYMYRCKIQTNCAFSSEMCTPRLLHTLISICKYYSRFLRPATHPSAMQSSYVQPTVTLNSPVPSSNALNMPITNQATIQSEDIDLQLSLLCSFFLVIMSSSTVSACTKHAIKQK